MKNLLLLVLCSCFCPALLLAQVSDAGIRQSLTQSLQAASFNDPAQVDYKVSSTYQTKHNGITHVYMNQVVNGLEIFNTSSAMHFSKEGRLIVFHNSFINRPATLISVTEPKLAGIDALRIGAAKEDMQLSTVANKDLAEEQGKMVWVDPNVSTENLYAKLGYLSKDGKLYLVWNVEFYNDATNDWWNMHVDASSGQVLQQTTSTAHCNINQVYHSGAVVSKPFIFDDETTLAKKSNTGTYNVFPLPLESPARGPRSMMSDVFTANASPFGWHDTDGVAGHEFTITRGNNVWAKEDTLNNNGSPNPGYSPDGGPTLTFDFPYDVNARPWTNLNFAITNLFYWNNIIHDIFYNYGFDEPAGNFQQRNYTGLGKGKDAVNADAQDGSGTSNANFSTPVDGTSGRMQMYLWPTSAASTPNTVQILSPSNITGIYVGPQSQFGPRLTAGGVTAKAVLVKDSNSTTSLACGGIANAAALDGSIALIDRGTCGFNTKILAAQAAGAVAVIVIQSSNGSPTAMTSQGTAGVTIPSVMISKTNGTVIRNAMANDSVVIRLFDSSATSTARIYDSDIDNGVITHEYGHGISTRLTGGPANSSCLQNAEQAGEGWSDFFALALTTRSWETSASAARGMGTFLVDQDTNGVGIRSYRYSRKMNINPVTYKTIATNTEVHALGFVWCSMLYDLFWDMIDKHGFDPDVYNGNGGNNKAIQLVIDGLKLQPCGPGFVDARNAIIKADSINNGGANYALIWNAFARRGLGYSANQGLSSKATDGTEAFDLPPGVTGIETAAIENDLRMYPNPSNNFVTIELMGSAHINTIELFDISGRLVQHMNATAETVVINIGDYTKGMYLVKIQTSKGSISKKLMVN